MLLRGVHVEALTLLIYLFILIFILQTRRLVKSWPRSWSSLLPRHARPPVINKTAARSLSAFLTRVRLRKLATSQRAENTPAVIQKKIHNPPKYTGALSTKKH